MSKITVTGGEGFIGRHLVSALKSLGHEVKIIDIKTDERLDVRDTESLRKELSDSEIVFHLAALPSVPYSIDHPEETHDTNLTGTLNVLSAARDGGVKRVVFSSSAAIYGNQTELPVAETAPLSPMSPYAMQKLASEMYLKHFADVHGLKTVSLRYFNVYGEGQSSSGPYASVIPKFFEQKKNGKPITITGDGSQTRDFVNIKDVVAANIAAMGSANVGKGEAINIASGESVSINKIAELFGGLVEHLPPRLEIKDSLADISLAKKLLDWEPKVSLEEGIRELLK